MSASDYNKKQMDAGKFTDDMVVQLVQSWQSENSLDVDGYCGPATQASLTKARSGKNPSSSELGLFC